MVDVPSIRPFMSLGSLILSRQKPTSARTTSRLRRAAAACRCRGAAAAPKAACTLSACIIVSICWKWKATTAFKPRKGQASKTGGELRSKRRLSLYTRDNRESCQRSQQS